MRTEIGDALRRSLGSFADIAGIGAVVDALDIAGFDIVRRAPAPTAAPTLYTASDLAALFQVDLKTIHNWVDRGRLDGFRTPGRHPRFTRENIEAFVTRGGYPAELLGALPVRRRKGAAS
jgi:excisionase family DNA binding protein